MYKFRIHPNAVTNFNRKASSIVERVSFRPHQVDGSPIRESGIEESGTTQPQSSGPDFYVSHSFTQADIIGEVTIGQVDADGNRVSCQWHDESGQFSISDHNYLDVRGLAAQLLKLQDIGSAISRETVEELICEWVRQSYAQTNNQSFIEFFSKEAGKRVCKFQVWTPIRYLSIHKSFKLGEVNFVPIDRTLLDEWEKQVLVQAQEHQDKIKQHFEKDMRPIQGHAAAVMEVTAEKQKAYDLLLNEANRALGLVRIFTVSSLLPGATSPCVLWGTGHIDKSFIFIVDDGRLQSLQQGFLKPNVQHEILSSEMIDTSFNLGLQRLHEILISNSRSEFEEAVLEAVLLYSKCTIAKDPADKLVYILVGLESILIKDRNEPITDNLSHRIAFLVGRNLSERKNIIRSIKDAYKLRSDFVHHGASIESLDVLQKFMEIAWQVVLSLIGATRQLKTRKDLLDYLDDKRLS